MSPQPSTFLSRRHALRTFAAAAAAGTGVLSACSNNDPMSGHTMPSATSSAPTSQSALDFNDADVMFAQMMIPHHQQAVVMSEIIIGKQGVRPEVMKLAEQIKAAQAPEIDQMTQWLKTWNRPTQAPSGMGHGSNDGMLSTEEIQRLRDADATQADKLFLTGMIGHHQGAIAMAESEIASGKYPAAIQMAKQIVTTQQTEISTMRQLLAQ